MDFKNFHINAFVSSQFQGNPAAVCLLEQWLRNDILQEIAFRNNCSETAFILKKDHFYDIRWFTPTTEVELCGHATMASAFVLFNYIEPEFNQIEFRSLKDSLYVKKDGDGLILNFPQEERILSYFSKSINFSYKDLYQVANHTLMAILDSEQEIKSFVADLDLLKKIEQSLVITAPSQQVDFVSRCFCPHEGIDEDPVTGSNHCFLGPFWSRQLQKKELRAWQLSPRGGELYLKILGNNRLEIRGKATFEKELILNIDV